MTTKELLDEYYWCKVSSEIPTNTIKHQNLERMHEIIKELEASIRKEVVLDILKLAVNTPEKVNELNVALDSRSRQELYLKAVGYWDCIKAVKEYALSKGIDIK